MNSQEGTCEPSFARLFFFLISTLWLGKFPQWSISITAAFIITYIFLSFFLSFLGYQINFDYELLLAIISHNFRRKPIVKFHWIDFCEFLEKFSLQTHFPLHAVKACEILSYCFRCHATHIRMKRLNCWRGVFEWSFVKKPKSFSKTHLSILKVISFDRCGSAYSFQLFNVVENQCKPCCNNKISNIATDHTNNESPESNSKSQMLALFFQKCFGYLWICYKQSVFIAIDSSQHVFFSFNNPIWQILFFFPSLWSQCHNLIFYTTLSSTIIAIIESKRIKYFETM